MGWEWRRRYFHLIIHQGKCGGFMCCDMIGLVTFDLVLGTILIRMMGIPFIIKILRMDFNDFPRDISSLRIPFYMVADFKVFHFYALMGWLQKYTHFVGQLS